PDERANMLAVTQVLMRLNYNDPGLFALFGGNQAMIESPLIAELLAGKTHQHILRILTKRFGTVPTEVRTALLAIVAEQRLEGLLDFAALDCPDLEAFRARLSS